MGALYFSLLGLIALVLGAGILGFTLRRSGSQERAQRFSRIMHFLFFAGLSLPAVIAVFYPGLTHLDELVGLSPLSPRPLFTTIGILLAFPGGYFLVAPNVLLRKKGSGANAFRLTKRVVDDGVYRMTRNPMSFGYYLLALAVALISGSALATLAVLFALIPAHVFFLKYLEELELELRFGESYRQYKVNVPSIIPKSPRD